MKAVAEVLDIIIQDIKTISIKDYSMVGIAFEGDGIPMYYDGVYENDYGEAVITMSTNAPFDRVTIEDIKSDIIAVCEKDIESCKVVFEMGFNGNCECAGYDGTYWDDVNDCIRICASSDEVEEEDFEEEYDSSEDD